MQNQQEQQSVSHYHVQPVKSPSRVTKTLNIFGIIFFLFCVVTIVTCVWAIIHRTPKNPQPDNLTTILVTVIVPILGVLYSYLQVHLAVNPPDFVRLPSFKPSTVEQTLSLSTVSSFSSLNPTPPATSLRVIQQPKRIVNDICQLFKQPDVTAVMLTGIAGVGKSTLAALVYQRYRKKKDSLFFLGKFFTLTPLWFEVQTNSTFDELAGELFKKLGRSLPVDFLKKTPDVKASLLIHTMEQVHGPHLVFLDQFDNWLEWNTGFALPGHPDIDAFLNAINNQKCKNQFLLTSRIRPRIRPRGSQIHLQACTRECLFEQLEFGEAVQLLRVCELDGTEIELERVVTYSNGHAGALVSLVSLLKYDEPSLDFHSIQCFQHWITKIHETIFKGLFQNFDYSDRDLLYNFSVYRTYIPLQIALNTQLQITNKNRTALDTLIKQHLFQKSKNDLYRLHPVLARCTEQHFYQIDKQSFKVAHDKAASYYESLGWKPHGMREHKEDIKHLLELVWHLCSAERKEEAQDLVQRENICTDLVQWKDDVALLELRELLA